MTLHISFLFKNWAFQVGDRLLTQKKRQFLNPFDKDSNKTIVFIPRNGIVSISYAGTAYIGDKPTDQWIAEILRGHELGKGKDSCIGSVKNWPDIGLSIQKLSNILKGVWPKLPQQQRDGNLEIIICGWQWPKNRRKPSPIMWGLMNYSKDQYKPFEIIRRNLPRCFPPNLLVRNTVGALVKEEDRQRILDAIINECRNGTEKTAELAVVNEIKRIAKTQETIGEDLMCVRINCYTNPQVYISYQKSLSRVHRKKKSSTNTPERTGMIIQAVDKTSPIPTMPPDIEQFEGVFSPWIVSESLVHPPSYIIGQLNIRAGGINIHIEGLPLPENKEGIIGGHIAQDRPLSPT